MNRSFRNGRFLLACLLSAPLGVFAGACDDGTVTIGGDDLGASGSAGAGDDDADVSPSGGSGGSGANSGWCLDEQIALRDVLLASRECRSTADCQIRYAGCGVSDAGCTGAVYVNQRTDTSRFESLLGELQACLGLDGACANCEVLAPPAACVDGRCQVAPAACTDAGCTCDPALEWNRKYAATSPRECAVVDYACPENTTMFGNSCGCGCQQDASCPRSFDCAQPSSCNVEELSRQCPYSTIALCDANVVGPIGERAPEGDALCADQPDCTVTGGAPDHVGCPNTCSCVCMRGACFTRTCTAIACTEPNVYR